MNENWNAVRTKVGTRDRPTTGASMDQNDVDDRLNGALKTLGTSPPQGAPPPPSTRTSESFNHVVDSLQHIVKTVVVVRGQQPLLAAGAGGARGRGVLLTGLLR